MPAIDVSTFLQRGQQYTITLRQGGWNPFAEGSDSVTEQLQAVPDISQLSVAPRGLFSSDYDVTFTYTGAGADVVAVVFQNMADALGGMTETWDFVGAVSGATGVEAATSSTNILGSIGVTPSVLWPIVIIAAIGLFVFSGGAAATRRALA